MDIRCALSAVPLTAAAVIMNSSRAGDEAPRFETDVQPLLIAHCYECHGRARPEGDADLRSVTLMTEPREWNAPLVIPGNPEQSRLIEVLESQSMPPDGPLPGGQLDLIRSWIAAGCPADSPDAVHGATFFQRWGILLCLLALSNVIVIGVLWRNTLPRGPLTIVLSGLPVIALSASSWFWYPPDPFGIAATVLMAVGVMLGGVLTAAANRRNVYAGAVWGLLAPIGLFFLREAKQAVGSS